VSHLAAPPGAVVTVAFPAGLRAFSSLVFQPLIVTNAVTYGALGTVLIVQSWLIGVGWVVYGGQLIGSWFHDAWLRAWADNRAAGGVSRKPARTPTITRSFVNIGDGMSGTGGSAYWLS
jgi:membrane protein